MFEALRPIMPFSNALLPMVMILISYNVSYPARTLCRLKKVKICLRQPPILLSLSIM
jgi:hypothetical protein